MKPRTCKRSRKLSIRIWQRKREATLNPAAMISARPPALSLRPPVPDDLLGSGKLDFRETVDQRRFAELYNSTPTTQ